MALTLYNSLTRQKEEFHPLNPPVVLFYTCGPTVYGKPHVGNYRTFNSFDVARRWLVKSGFDVRFVQNITDVDDKIIRRAAEEGETPGAVAEKYTAFFLEMNKQLDFLPATRNPRATEYIGKMIAMVKKLEAAGHAYASADGSVWFHVPSFPDYGKLSNLPLDQIVEGERVDPEQQKLKRDSRDFALWKGAKPGEPAWKSPWGEGRPGWHLECSVMAMDALGAETIDIHGGGSDLRFPHHENEIAQSEACTKKPFARYWLHAGMLDIDGEKMSKSLGNIQSIDGMIGAFGVLTVRYFLVSARYRDKLDFTEHAIGAAASAQGRLVTASREARRLLARHGLEADREGWKTRAELAAVWADFAAAMDDDFNTPRALGVMNTFLTATNQAITRVEGGDEGAAPELAARMGLLLEMRWVLGLTEVLEPVGTELDSGTLAAVAALAAAQGVTGEGGAGLVQALIERRQQARKERDFARGDAIRDGLAAVGITLEDKPGETTWRLLR